MQKTLYIGNLPSHRDAGAVEQLLLGCGKVLHLKVMTHTDFVRRHGGFAIVEMGSETDALTAIETLNDSDFLGNTLVVRVATVAEITDAGHAQVFSKMSDGPVPPSDV
jgi:RNA recognition motif-containing protein